MSYREHVGRFRIDVRPYQETGDQRRPGQRGRSQAEVQGGQRLHGVCGIHKEGDQAV